MYVLCLYTGLCAIGGRHFSVSAALRVPTGVCLCVSVCMCVGVGVCVFVHRTWCERWPSLLRRCCTESSHRCVFVCECVRVCVCVCVCTQDLVRKVAVTSPSVLHREFPQGCVCVCVCVCARVCVCVCECECVCVCVSVSLCLCVKR